MSARYHRSPLLAYVLAMTAIGWEFVIPRMAADLNALSARRVVDPSFFRTLIGLLLALYFTVLLVLASNLDVLDPSRSLEAQAFLVAVLTVGISIVVVIAASLTTFHLRINRAFGEPTNILSIGFILLLTIPLFLSVPYLEHRLNRLADGRAPQGAAVGALA